jgi:U6 snRNA-associated Sm-like protein LSm8
VAQLGLYLIRGENVAVVGLIEEQLDAKVDYESLCAEPLMAVIH